MDVADLQEWWLNAARLEAARSRRPEAGVGATRANDRPPPGAAFALVYARPTDAADGIAAFSRLLGLKLRGEGYSVRDVWWQRSRAQRHVRGDAADYTILHYNPFSYGRRGIAPALVASERRSRHASGRGRRILMLHEPYVPRASARWSLLSLYQRAQLAALIGTTDKLAITAEVWRHRLGRLARGRPISHVPVTSNLPDERDARERIRTVHQWGPDTIVLATFGGNDGSRLMTYVVDAANAVASAGHRTTLLNLGAHAPHLFKLDASVEVHAPGLIGATELAALLSAADVFLAPFVDGFSGRRTSALAALQHAVAVISTDGVNTDPSLRADPMGLLLTPVERPSDFTSATVMLANDAVERHAVGERGHAVFARRFAWPEVLRALFAAACGPDDAPG